MHISGISACQAICRIFLYFPAKHYQIIKYSCFSGLLHPGTYPSSWDTCAHSITMFNWVCCPREHALAECPALKSHENCTHRPLPGAVRLSSWFGTLGFVLLTKSGKTIFFIHSSTTSAPPFALTCFTFLLPRCFSTLFCASLLWFMYLERCGGAMF